MHFSVFYCDFLLCLLWLIFSSFHALDSLKKLFFTVATHDFLLHSYIFKKDHQKLANLMLLSSSLLQYATPLLGTLPFLHSNFGHLNLRACLPLLMCDFFFHSLFVCLLCNLFCRFLPFKFCCIGVRSFASIFFLYFLLLNKGHVYVSSLFYCVLLFSCIMNL